MKSLVFRVAAVLLIAGAGASGTRDEGRVPELRPVDPNLAAGNFQTFQNLVDKAI